MTYSLFLTLLQLQTLFKVDKYIINPPIINDVFKQYRKENNITIYEMNQLFITFRNKNKNQNDEIIFYTINGSDPRKEGIPYDDNKESETGIIISINDVPIIIKAVIGKLGLFDEIIWSLIATKTFYNPNPYNHSNFGAGFNKIPIKFRKQNSLIVRIWPKRFNDLIKCVYSTNKYSKVINNKKSFWSDRFSSKSVNLSHINLNAFTQKKLLYFDVKLDIKNSHHIYKDYIVACSTSSKSIKETIKNPDYSSMLIKAKNDW